MRVERMWPTDHKHKMKVTGTKVLANTDGQPIGATHLMCTHAGCKEFLFVQHGWFKEKGK